MKRLQFRIPAENNEPSTAYEWQDRALHIWENFGSPPDKKSEIMRLVQNHRQLVESVFRYMQERKINSIFYFFKVFNSKLNEERSRRKNNL